jgi:hypothetical protein
VIESHETAKWILDHFGTNVHDVRAIDRAYLERRSLLMRWIDRAAAVWARF